jgi:asparagine N-glycosylation enzyme membrane subunit Stt3
MQKHSHNSEFNIKEHKNKNENECGRTDKNNYEINHRKQTDVKDSRSSRERGGEQPNVTDSRGGGGEQKEIIINLTWFKRNYTAIILIMIILLSFWLRTFNFHYNWLLNVDSYFHYRYMKYIASGEVENLTLIRDNMLINATYPLYDPLMEAPNGRIFRPNFYHYIGAYSYLIAKMILPNLQLWIFLIYFPVLLISLCAIPAYYIGKTLYDKRAGLLTAFLFLFNPSILARTMGGDPDNDCWVLLLPLVTLAFFLLANKYSEEKKMKQALIYSLLSGVFFAVLAYSWVYWHVFYLITGFVILKIIISVILEYLSGKKITLKDYKPLIAIYFTTIITFFLFTVPIIGTVVIKHSFLGPLQALQLKAETGEFPNVYVSVAEMMQGGDVKTIAARVGTPLFFFSMVCFLPYAIASFIFRRKHLDTLIFVTLWILGFLYASIFAIRFTIFLVFPLSLASAIFLIKLLRLANGEDKEILE